MTGRAFTVRMDESEVKAIDALAKRRSRSRNDMIRHAVAELLAFEEAQVAKVARGLADAAAGRFASEARMARIINKHKPDRTG